MKGSCSYLGPDTASILRRVRLAPQLLYSNQSISEFAMVTVDMKEAFYRIHSNRDFNLIIKGKKFKSGLVVFGSKFGPRALECACRHLIRTACDSLHELDLSDTYIYYYLDDIIIISQFAERIRDRLEEVASMYGFDLPRDKQSVVQFVRRDGRWVSGKFDSFSYLGMLFTPEGFSCKQVKTQVPDFPDGTVSLTKREAFRIAGRQDLLWAHPERALGCDLLRSQLGKVP